MSARSIRRAIERKARKQALKAGRHQDEQLAAREAQDVDAENLAASDVTAEQAIAAYSTSSAGAFAGQLTQTLAANSTRSFENTPIRSPRLSGGYAPPLPGSDDDPNPLRRAAFKRRADSNRENAQLSTGPVTPEGKAASSLNALKTGLTGRTVLLAEDDAAAYQAHVRRFFDEHQPSGDRETELVQSLADTRWRILRIPSLETGIYALGRIQFAELFSSYEPSARAALIQAHTHLTFQKQLNNLALQETRLRRHFQKDLLELQHLQADRRRHQPQPINPPARNGFEFSSDAPSHPNQPSQPLFDDEIPIDDAA